MRILIIGGTAVTRQAIQTLLQTKPENQLVQEVSMEQIDMSDMPEQFDLLLINSWSSAETITKLIKTLHAARPKSSIVILSGRPEVQKAALAAGADAFVLKGDPPRKLLTAIETVRLKREYV